MEGQDVNRQRGRPFHVGKQQSQGQKWPSKQETEERISRTKRYVCRDVRRT